jgi:hypothetical protein
MIGAIVNIITRILGPVLAIFWARGDAVKDAKAKADLDAHRRLNDVEDTSGLSDAERIKRLHDVSRRLGG